LVNRVQTLRSSSQGVRPTGRSPGELYVNFPDRQIGVVDASAAAVDLVAVRFFSTGASYAVGDYVVQAGVLYRATAVSAPGAFAPANWSKLTTLADAAATSPLMDGVASAGVAVTWSRGDHVHPTDTTLVPLAGGTMTGPLVLNANPSAALGAATKQQVDLKADLASPTFTGDPKAPTPLTADNDTSIATTAYVKAQGYAGTASPVFTGDPQAPTPATADNDTSIATTAFVKAQGYATLAAPVFTGDARAVTATAGDNDTSIATTAFVQAAIGTVAPLPGTIYAYVGNVAPTGYFLCNGQNINRAANPTINGILGGLTPAYPFGAGDGSTTMGIPDLRGRAPVGIHDMAGSPGTARISTATMSVLTLGGVGGEEVHVPTYNEMFQHNHTGTFRSNVNSSQTFTPSGAAPAGLTSAVVTSEGRSAAHNTMQPSQLVGYIMKGG
jgi:microcystin-dependent protein